MNRKFFIALFLSVVVGTQVLLAQAKREFRGAWIQCVNGQFLGLGKDRMQQVLRSQLDEMQKDGVNAVIFQVRPECLICQSIRALESFSYRATGTSTSAILGSIGMDDRRVSQARNGVTCMD